MEATCAATCAAVSFTLPAGCGPRVAQELRSPPRASCRPARERPLCSAARSCACRSRSDRRMQFLGAEHDGPLFELLCAQRLPSSSTVHPSRKCEGEGETPGRLVPQFFATASSSAPETRARRFVQRMKSLPCRPRWPTCSADISGCRRRRGPAARASRRRSPRRRALARRPPTRRLAAALHAAFARRSLRQHAPAHQHIATERLHSDALGAQLDLRHSARLRSPCRQLA
jgi:hypothetical protein